MKDYEKILEARINKVKREVPEPNRSVIIDFIEEDRAKEIGLGRLSEELHQLIIVSSVLGKDFRKATKKDIVRVINELKTRNGKEYAESYLSQFKIVMGKLFRNLGMKSLVIDEDGKINDALKARGMNRVRITNKDILTEEEVQKIIRSCSKLRDRCFLSLLYETGARRSELAELRRKDIKLENDQAVIRIRTLKRKDETEREVPVVFAVPDLIAYLDNMTDKGPDAMLWNVKSTGLWEIVNRASKRAGIEKRVWPHLFRHSRASHVAPLIPESIQRRMFGWASKLTRLIYTKKSTIDQFYNMIGGFAAANKQMWTATDAIMRCFSIFLSSGLPFLFNSYTMARMSRSEKLRSRVRKLSPMGRLTKENILSAMGSLTKEAITQGIARTNANNQYLFMKLTSFFHAF